MRPRVTCSCNAASATRSATARATGLAWRSTKIRELAVKHPACPTPRHTMPLVVPATASAAPPPALAPMPAAPPLTADEAEESVELAVVKSPIVGTFYRSPEPGAAAFVEVGQRVKKDQVLCIIEAMKLMNEITSEYDGEIVSAYVENGKPVQYGERLFAIKTA